MLRRRQFLQGIGAAAVAVLPAWAQEVGGVVLGLQTYTFHTIRQGGIGAVDEILAGMLQLRVGIMELWAPQAEPFALPVRYWSGWTGSADRGTPAMPSAPDLDSRRRDLRAWRTNTPSTYFREILHRANIARVGIFAYNYSFEPTMTDAEIEHGFYAARQLQVKLITSSSRISVAKRVVPFAERYGIPVAFHNHSATKDPDDVASPESFRAVLALSSLFRINLDIAHFAASGFDPVALLEEQHAKITNLHVHDRMANDGKSVPMGQGVAPVRQVLKLNRDRGWKIPCFYELEYVGADGRGVIQETRRELDYALHALNEK